MGPLKEGLPKDLSKTGLSGYGSVCVSSVSSTSRLHVLEGRLVQSSNGCFLTTMVSSIPLCFPSILSDRKSTCQGQARKSVHDIDNSTLANTTMVRTSLEDVNENSIDITSISGLATESTGADTSVGSQQYTKASGLEHFRENLESEGISKRAAMLISGFRRQGTLSNYESAWRKWSSWRGERQINPIECPINNVLNFLTYLHDSRYEYSTINCHRSAILAYRNMVNDTPVGKHPLVCKLMFSIFVNEIL